MVVEFRNEIPGALLVTPRYVVSVEQPSCAPEGRTDAECPGSCAHDLIVELLHRALRPVPLLGCTNIVKNGKYVRVDPVTVEPARPLRMHDVVRHCVAEQLGLIQTLQGFERK